MSHAGSNEAVAVPDPSGDGFGDGLGGKLAAWVDAGLLTAEAALAIADHERALRATTSPASRPGDGGTRARRVPVVAEVLGYLGAIVVASTGGVLLTQFWSDISAAGHLAVVAGLTVVMVVAARSVSRLDDPTVHRLCSFLWLLVVAGVTWFVALVAVEDLELDGARVAMAAGAAAAVTSAWLLAWRRSLAHHLSLFAGVLALVLGTVGQWEGIEGEHVGLVVWGLAVAWVLVSWGGWLPHPAAGEVVGGLCAMWSCTMVATAEASWGIWLGVLTGSSLLVAASAARQRAMLIPGVPGLLFSTIGALGYYLGGEGGMGAGPVVVVLAIGLGLLAAAVIGARRGGGTTGADTGVAS